MLRPRRLGEALRFENRRGRKRFGWTSRGKRFELGKQISRPPKKERFNWEEALRRETAMPFRAKHGPGERFISKGPDNEALRHARPGRLGEALQSEEGKKRFTLRG